MEKQVSNVNTIKPKPSNVYYYEPSKTLFFTYLEYIYELSYKANIVLREVKFLLYNRTTKKKLQSDKLPYDYFTDNETNISKFDSYFQNVFTKPKAFIIEKLEAEEGDDSLSIKIYELDHFNNSVRSFTIILFSELKEEEVVKDEEDSLIEAEICQMASDLEEKQPQLTKEEQIKNKDTEIGELKIKINKLEKDKANAIASHNFDIKYAHVPVTIKYCKGLKHGCSFKNPLWGSNPYAVDTVDGIYCQAARHAGVIDDEGGFYIVKHIGVENNLVGSHRNGITSGNFTPYNAVTIHSLDKKIFNKKFDICGNINL